MSSVPESEQDKSRHLRSDAGRELLRFKHDLTLELCLQRGPFWAAVRDMRKNWQIHPIRQVPPPNSYLFGPRDLSRPLEEWGYADSASDAEELQESELEDQWERDLYAVLHRTIPQEHIQGAGWDHGWLRFIAGCVLCDPPETELLAFADRDGPELRGPPLPSGKDYSDDELEKMPYMLAPPIRELRDAYEAEQTANWFWQRFIKELGDRHLKPLGLDIDAMAYDILHNSPELMSEYRKRQARNQPRVYILVDEHISARDVRRAFKMIAATRRGRSGGASRRDPLVAVQCAILYDRHNTTDPSDRRRRAWTYKRLAEEFDLKSAGAAKAYVVEGRRILSCQ